MRRRILAITTLVGALAMSGCSSVQSGEAVPVAITSTGLGASSVAVVSAPGSIPVSRGPDTGGSSPVLPTSAAAESGRTVTVTQTPVTTIRATPSSTTASSPVVQPPPLAPEVDAAPGCWSDHSCPALARTSIGGGWSVVAVNPSQDASVMILLSGDRPYDQLAMRDLGAHPVLTCKTVASAPTCLMSGVPGAHTAFGSVARIANGRLQNLTKGEMFSEGGFGFVQINSNSALIVGMIAFYDYGLSYAASPKASITYSVTTTMKQTGCSAPAFDGSTDPKTAQHGPCSGTPRISGYDAGSANKILDLGRGMVSKSGNLWCTGQAYGDGEVDCVINQIDFTVAKDCEGEPGTIVRWASGRAPVLSGCQGDSMVTAGRQMIAYGQLAAAGDVICVISQTGGVRCENYQHHGFILSRAKFSTF